MIESKMRQCLSEYWDGLWWLCASVMSPFTHFHPVARADPMPIIGPCMQPKKVLLVCIAATENKAL